MLLSVGYSDEMAGLCCSLVILSGAAGTVMFGVAAEKTGKIVEITKFCCFGSIICILILSYLLLIPDVGEYIIAACLLLGIFALGVFPLALELTVEATFPADQVHWCILDLPILLTVSYLSSQQVSDRSYCTPLYPLLWTTIYPL